MDNGIDLIVKTQENISKLSMVSGTAHLLNHNGCLFLRMWCWKDAYLVEHSANVNGTAMRAVYPNVHRVIKSMPTTSCANASVERCLSRWRCYKNTCKITAEKNNWIAVAMIALHRNVKVNYSKSIDFLRSKQHRQLLNSETGYFWSTTLDWHFLFRWCGHNFWN